MHFRLAALALSFLLPATSAQAEIRKLMILNPGMLSATYELVLTPPKGWTEDQVASEQNGVQILVPRGRTFGNAPALMYVKISSRRNNQSTEEFVSNSQKRWRESVRDTKISKIADVERANGKSAFVSYRYENPSQAQQRFEAVPCSQKTRPMPSSKM